MSGTSLPPAVSLRSITVQAGGHRALADVDLDIAAGEKVALVGPSGAGKTTLLMVVNGTLEPQHGEVRVFGGRPSLPGRQGRRARSRVGTVHQQLHLAGPLQVVHNVNAGRLPHWSLPRALRSLVRPLEVSASRDLLARVGIADKLHERTERLSGGEQQRVAIARVLAQQPDLVLADEPISSLDPARAREVLDLLCALATEDGRTLVVSLHAFPLARSRCDRIIGLRDGRIVLDAPADEVTDDVADRIYAPAGR